METYDSFAVASTVITYWANEQQPTNYKLMKRNIKYRT